MQCCKAYWDHFRLRRKHRKWYYTTCEMFYFFSIYKIHLILSIIRQAVIELKHILFCLLPFGFSTILTLGGDAWWSSCWHASKTIMLSPNIYFPPPPPLGPSCFPRKLIYGSLWGRPAAVAAWMGAIRSQE